MIRVALSHRTTYRFDRLVSVGPHEIRLRPAPHCRTPVLGYSLNVAPEPHFLNWQQDPYGNWVARLVFPEPARELEIEVDLVADLTVVNPFDFFVEEYAEKFPFSYAPALAKELIPFLETAPIGPLLAAWLTDFRKTVQPGEHTVMLLVRLNQLLQQQVKYLVRMEPGVQAPEETLRNASGSCRDSGWLLVQVLRHLGIAARFASGYLVQLVADVKALDGPSGTDRDFTDLHAWAEAFVPGAGWIGLDPTSGLLAGEGHLPLACTADPGNAAPVIGYTDVCNVDFGFAMSVTRVHEDPRVTRPFTDAQWAAIDALGHKVDRDLAAHDVRLTQGGEPTFVSIDDVDGAEWKYTALSARKRELAETLLARLRARFAPNGFLHFGQGKWYPGEPLPRWALGLVWRADGQPLWRHDDLIADTRQPGRATAATARVFGERLVHALRLPPALLITAYEDAPGPPQTEAALPAPAGFVLPLRAAEEADGGVGFVSGPWPLQRGQLFALAGDSPLGLRLPLSSLPDVLPEALGDGSAVGPTASREVIRTALALEVRDGHLYVFMPPIERLEAYVALLAAVEDTAAALCVPVAIEGYPPPRDPRIKVLMVTPDPGVIEVNVHPSATWRELIDTTSTLYEEARLARLTTEKFMLDGRHTGTGGGNHVTLGGLTPADSPLLRRPDLLRSLVTYWQNHPSLSYLFAGMFVGPTSQAPRVDEARDDRLYELAIAFQQLALHGQTAHETAQPWLVDRLLRHLLTDLTGNTHRAEFSIDKLYSPDSPAGRLGLLELRAFEMPPHWRMSALQMVLLRALVARFWRDPFAGDLVPWGTSLHDRWLLPHYVAADIRDVARDLTRAGYPFDPAWLEPFVEFRFPRYGTVTCDAVTLELRQAIEPWHVLGEEVSGSGTARFVDSSLERLQVKVTGMTAGRHAVTCNGRMLPLASSGLPGEYVAGVRYRAWNPPSALHPTLGVHAPLTFDLVDTWAQRALGGCTYHVAHPGGRNYDTFPVNANEAEARRTARFWAHGHTPGPMQVYPEPPNPATPATLDLRWQPPRG
ncbi:MAG: transglutaminase family protein [Burkholderiales bacterium]|nr:transglutaminase family protein [Burkholderiales bacterium]